MKLNDKQVNAIGLLVADLFVQFAEGEKMAAEMGAEVNSISSQFNLKGDNGSAGLWRITLERSKTEEEEALEGMPAGTKYFPGLDGGPGLYAIPDPVDEEG